MVYPRGGANIPSGGLVSKAAWADASDAGSGLPSTKIPSMSLCIVGERRNGTARGHDLPTGWPRRSVPALLSAVPDLSRDLRGDPNLLHVRRLPAQRSQPGGLTARRPSPGDHRPRAPRLALRPLSVQSRAAFLAPARELAGVHPAGTRVDRLLVPRAGSVARTFLRLARDRRQTRWNLRAGAPPPSLALGGAPRTRRCP